MAESKDEFRRLDTDIVPDLYKLHLAIDFKESKYFGDLTVECDVNKAVSVLTINSLELKFTSTATFANGAGETIAESTDIVTDDELQTVTFKFGSDIPTGKHSLHVKYEGALKRALCGLYKSSYISSVDGTEKVIATTQFEPTDARRMLPCWDEPAIKARFRLSLTVPAGNTKAISNMPIVEERTLTENTKLVEFDTSPIMSTYLLALVVGEFDFVSTWFENIEIRTYTSVGNSQKGLFSLDVAKRALEFFHKYFEIPYALPKVDLIAIPDFAMGAMENWGLITYRESRLLCDPESESQSGRIDKGKVVCHELTHMWFGNLVTMEWWTHLWLNEGFARFLENTCLAHLFPEYNIMDAFVADVTELVLNLDALLSSHPIEVAVKHPKEINEIFDAISYAKGGSVLRMLDNFLTPEVFRQGISHYLKRFSYKNTQTEDLWNALSEVSKKDVEGFMKNWTGKMGYPVVKVEQVKDGAAGMTLKFTQERFLASGEKSPEATVWSINIVLQSADGEERFQLDKESDTFNIPSWNPDSWVKANAGQFGFFRVEYPDDLSKRLMEPIQSKTLSAVDRLGVVNDSFAMAQAGRVSVTQFLDLLTAYKDEDDANVAGAISKHLSGLKKLHASEEYSKILGDVVTHQFLPLYQKLGWEASPNEDAQVSKLRTTVLSAMRQHPDAISEVQRRLRASVEDPQANKIAGDQRPFIYQTAVASDSSPWSYEAVLGIYNKVDLQQEKQRCMIALTKTKDSALLERTLEWNLSDAVRPNTAYWPIISAARTAHNYKQAWAFFKENFQLFYEKFPEGMKQVLGSVIYAFAGSFASMEYHEDVRTFFEKNPCPEAATKIKQSLEAISVNAKRFERQTADLSQWLSKWHEVHQATA